MDDERMVKQMAESVIRTSTEYLDTHEDFVDVLKRRPKDITRKIDMVAENALDSAIYRKASVRGSSPRSLASASCRRPERPSIR